MAEESFDDKTEAPTDKRRNETRQKGNVAKSTEINSVLVLIVGILMLKFFGPWMMKQMGGHMYEMFQSISNTAMDQQRVTDLTIKALVTTLWVLAPVACGIMFIGIIANVAQVGFLFTAEPLIPKLDKIDPVAGFKRLISMRSLVETVKNIVKLFIIGWVAYLTLAAAFPKMMMLADASVGTIFAFAAETTYDIFMRVALVLAILAVLDYAYNRYDHEKKLKMTKQEVKDEHKQMEGDPKVKARIKSMQREIARRRMMQEVPKATVVVTNPTYIAIALRYEPSENDSPVVVAKGKRLIAARIKQVAIENGIPIVEDKPLARGMYDKVVVGFPIPADFFAAVAEIMAYVYRLTHKAAA
jgi:flagellar biosynthesis protein FlhB